MALETTTLKDWYDMKKQRDEAIGEWVRGVKIARCPECGQPYSFGYEPVMEDPGACQSCRGAEGDLVIG